MAEIGLDISLEFPKRLTTDQVQAADFAITMFVDEPGPSTRGKRYLDRGTAPTPAGLDR